MTAAGTRRPFGDRDVARAHGRLQVELSALREHLDESVEASTNHIADETVDVLRRLTLAAQHVRRRAERITTTEETQTP